MADTQFPVFDMVGDPCCTEGASEADSHLQGFSSLHLQTIIASEPADCLSSHPACHPNCMWP